jgi:hypothetical protein
MCGHLLTRMTARRQDFIWFNMLFLPQILNMKEFIKKHHFLILFALVGATGGFLYWKFIGCESGTCMIKSKWYLSTLWGGAFGYLLGGIIRDLIVKFRNKSKADGSSGS